MTTILDRMRSHLAKDGQYGAAAGRSEAAPLPQAGGEAAQRTMPAAGGGYGASAAPGGSTAAPAGAVAATASTAGIAGTAAPCSTCGGLLFWQNAYGNIQCERCQEPPSPAIVRKKLFVDVNSTPPKFIDANSEAGQAAIISAEMAARKNFPQPKICDDCSGNIFWLDWSGKIWCRHCRPINDENRADVQKIIFVCLNRDFKEGDGQSKKFIWGDEKWPPPRQVVEVCSDAEKKYFEEMKRRRQEWEETHTMDAAVALASWRGKNGTAPAGTTKRKKR